MPRIGLLGVGGAGVEPLREAFRQGLRDLGYVLGQTAILEERGHEVGNDQFPALAAELVALPVDVMVIHGAPAIAAAKEATRTIPIVMASGGIDPVKANFVASLARPGGNITGLSNISPQLSGKRFELLKEMVPGLSRVAVLWNPAPDSGADQWEETRVAAQGFGLQLQSLQVTSQDGFESAFDVAVRQQAQALVVLSDPITVSGQVRLGQLATRSQLPAVFNQRGFAEAGGLMVYGPNIFDNFRRAATYVDKILKGAKPGDLPVEQSTKFDFVINLKTAQALGLTIPQSALVQATELIQ